MPPEPTFLDAFKENPAPIFLAFVLGAAGFALVVVALTLALKRSRAGVLLGVAAAACGVGAMLSGVYGTISKRRYTDEVITAPGLTAKDIERIRAYAYAEASFTWEAGAGAGLLPLLGGVGSAGLALARRKR